VVVDEDTVAWLLAHPGAQVEVDLESTTLRLPGGRETRFPIEAFARYCLLNGVDELGFLLSKESQISAYERQVAT
jgi:3-isopropylmalate/(R)-2-methylmalate dehydratase small subunit